MQPDIIRRKYTFVGLEADVDLREDFSGLFLGMRLRLAENLGRLAGLAEPVRPVGIWMPYPGGEDEACEAKRRYFMGVEVTGAIAVPDGFLVKDLPESLFALFREQTRGTVSRYAYTEWLPASGYILNEDLLCDMEIFDGMERTAPHDACDILLPVRANGDA